MLLLPSPLINTLLKAYVQEWVLVLLFLAQCIMYSIRQEITRQNKDKKYTEEMKQASDQTETWQRCQNYQTRDLKTVINMLRGLMEKVDILQEHVSNVSRETEILRNSNSLCPFNQFLNVQRRSAQAKSLGSGPSVSHLICINIDSQSIKTCSHGEVIKRNGGEHFCGPGCA